MDRVSSVTDPLNNLTEFEYDSLGRLTERRDPAITAGVPTTKYGYDADGNLATLMDPAGNTTAWTYDNRNRPTFESITVNTQTLTREFQYDEADNLVWEKDRNDRWKNFVYTFRFGAPGDYRLERENWWTSANGIENRIVYEFNEGNGLLMTAVADQDNITNPTVIDSRVEFSYDELPRVKTIRDFIDPTAALDTTTFDLNYSYDTIDRRVYTDAKFSETGLNPTGDFENRYVWDDLNRVKRVEQFTPSAADPNVLDPALKKTVDLEYYAQGALKKITRVQGSDPSTGVADTASDALVTDYVLEYPEWWFVGRISRIEHSGLGSSATQPDF
jgi:YD repeat-containing protein